MQVIKFDKARREIILKDTKNNKRIKAVELDYFTQQNTFDKHLSTFFNHKGLTYILENPSKEQDEDEVMTIKSKVEIDEELNNRYFAGLDEASKQAILELQEEYIFTK